MGRQLDPNKTYFFNGKVVVDGNAYFGLPNQDPTEVANQIQIWADRACSVPLSQPQKTSDQGILPTIYIADPLYSFYIETSNEEGNEQIIYEPELEPLNTQGLVTSDIDMNGFKHLNVAEATENNQYLTLGQAFRMFPQAVVVDATSAPDAIVANLPVNPIALLFGQPIRLYLTHGANTGPFTIKLGAFGAKFAYKGNNLAPDAGDTWGNQAFIDVIYDITLDKYQILNPKNSENAKLLQGQNGAYYLARVNHTGTQVMATISDAGALATLNSVGAAEIDTNAVGQSEIAANAVHQSEVSTSVATDNFTVNPGGITVGISADRRVMSGGQYAFQPRTETTNDTGTQENSWFCFGAIENGTYSLNNYIAMCAITGSGGGSGSYNGEARSRYIDASAPWNIGDGDIALFIFLRRNKDGEFNGCSVASAPVWGYNGPTNIVPDRVSKYLNEAGQTVGVRKYKKVINPESEIIVPPWRGGDPKKWNVDKYLNPEIVEVEIDHTMKNKDMNLIPHPFLTLRQGEEVILIEPCSSFVDQLAVLYEKSEESIYAIFKNGYAELTEEIKNCCKPEGVAVYGARWTNKGA